MLPALLAAVALTGAHDPCVRTRDLHPGPGRGGLYRTPAPFEHFDARRSQVFPYSCTLRELTGIARPKIRTRRAPGFFDTPYSIVTRGRRGLYVYGYAADANARGAAVSRVDPRTLKTLWTRRIRDTSPRAQWSYPGVALAHADGRIDAIYGNRVVSLDAVTGRVRARRALPESPSGTGAAYNGMVPTPDGNLVAKKIERGPCPTAFAPPPSAPAGALAGLACAGANALPSELVVLDPRGLRILARARPPEPVTGRITYAGGYVYCAGRDHLFRYRYRHGRLRRDSAWGMVRYRSGVQTPGTGPGLLGHWLVVQTNFLPSTAPLTVTAVDVRDSKRVFRIRPFGAAPGGSWIVSKPALDTANATVITHDTRAGRMAALRLDPKHGFRVRWRRPLTALAFSALVGPARGRQIVVPDHTASGERVVWLDERTGRERAATRVLDPQPAPGNIVVPGYGGRFWYASNSGRLFALRPVR